MNRRGLPVRPYYVQHIQEGSAVHVSWLSRDSEQSPVELESLEYRVDNLTDGLMVQNWQTVDEPEHRGSVTIPASLNTLARDWRDSQLNQVTFRMVDTDGNQTQQLSHYQIAATFEGVVA